jgi:hypothetical protein
MATHHSKYALTWKSVTKVNGIDFEMQTLYYNCMAIRLVKE